MFARFCQLQRTSALFQDSNYRCVRPRGRPGDPKMTRQDLDKAYQQEFEDITDYEQSVPGSYNLLFDAYMKAYRTHDLDELFFWIEDPSIDLSCEIFQYGGPLLNRVVMETPPWPEAKRIINAILKNAKGKNVIDRRNKHFNDSPMSCAIKTRNYDMAVYLMEKGAAVDYVNRITGDNLLHSAAADETSDSNALIKILLEKGVPLNAPNLKGETPLHACLQRNSKAEDWNLRIEKAIFLIDLGANPIHLTKERNSVLHCLVDMQGFYNCKQGIHNFPADYMDTLSRFVVLVKEYGYNFETLNNQGLCATLYAISLGQWNIAQTILELVPDESIPSDFLHHTIAEIFKGLFNPLLLSYFDLVNDSPLYSDDEDSIQQNLKYCLELIIDRVGGANEADPNGATPLDYAVYLGTAEMATVVAQNGGFLTGNFSGIQDQYDLKVPIHRAFGNYHVVTKSLDYHQLYCSQVDPDFPSDGLKDYDSDVIVRTLFAIRHFFEPRYSGSFDRLQGLLLTSSLHESARVVQEYFFRKENGLITHAMTLQEYAMKRMDLARQLNPLTSSDPNILCRLVYLWLITREYRISLVGLIPCLIADGATSLLTADLNLEPHFNSMFDKKHREVLIFFMFLRLCGFPIARVVPGALPSSILPDKIMSSFERCGKADYVSDRLQRVMNHPLSLAEWCRISFRRALPPHSTPVVMRLNLPPPLKRFISMEHEVMKLLELERASFDKYEEEGTWEASLAVDSEEDIEHVIQALR